MEKIERITAPRGMPDALPSDMPLLRRIEDTAHRVFRLYGYEEIRTPMFEETRLFVRGIGEATDIVEKEMYTFSDPAAPASDSITLRPEGTAPVVRAVVEHDLLKQQGFWKLYYIGPMFRKERPQAGRLRQFEQIGCEAVGSSEPVVDAESILLAARFFNEVGLPGVQVKINSISCPTCRTAYREVLRNLLAPRRAELCKDCQSRFDRNVFRVLDCKNPTCREIARVAPPMRDHLDADCRAHFDAVTTLLTVAGLEFKIDDHLVRGFDYYTRTVFELSHSALGARDAVCGGGRYDNLVAELGGPPAGCVGFAVGVVPTVLALQKQKTAEALQPGADADAYLIAVTSAADKIVSDNARISRIVDKIFAEYIRANADVSSAADKIISDNAKLSRIVDKIIAEHIRSNADVSSAADRIASDNAKLSRIVNKIVAEHIRANADFSIAADQIVSDNANISRIVDKITADHIRADTEIFSIAEKLRAVGIRAEMDYERRSLKAQMRSANKLRARYAIFVGPEEVAAGKLKLKDMATGEERLLNLEEIATLLKAEKSK